MNYADNEFHLVKIQKRKNIVYFFIELAADTRTREVYLNNYFENLYISIGNEKFNIYTKIEENDIVGEILYETICGLSAKNNTQKLWVRIRIGNTYIDHPVKIALGEIELFWGYRDQYCFKPINELEFNFTNYINEVALYNPLKKIKKEISDIKIDILKKSLLLHGKVNGQLNQAIENGFLHNRFCLACKNIKGKEIYYFHESSIINGEIEYRLTTEEISQLGRIETDGKIFDWVMVDEEDKEYKLYLKDSIENDPILLPTDDYYAEIFSNKNGSIQMRVITIPFFYYVELALNGDGIILDIDKRSYHFELLSVFAQRVNTDIEYELPFTLIRENMGKVTYKVELLFNVLEENFKIGIHQFWIMIQDGISVQKYPLKLFRKNPIFENTYLTALHPYTSLGGHYYETLFYNDKSNNLKCNIVPMTMKMQIREAYVSKNMIEISLFIIKEPYFEKVTNVYLASENNELVDIGFESAESLDSTWNICVVMHIPLILLNSAGSNVMFRPEICYDGRSMRTKVENNLYRPAITNRETKSFSEIREIAPNKYRRIWGNHIGDSYAVGSSENCKLLKESGIWIDEDNTLCVRLNYMNSITDKDIIETLDNQEVNLYMKDKFTDSVISFERENKVVDEIIYKIPLSIIVCTEYTIYGQLSNSMITYLTMTSPVSLLVSHETKKKVQIRKADDFLELNVTELLIYEDPERIQQCKEIIVKAQEEKHISCPIWLIGENYGLSARDNGLAFFEYCMQNINFIDAKCFYVTKETNEDMSFLELYKDHLLIYDSPEHIYYDELAEFYIVSHGIRDVMPSLYHDKIGAYRKNVIYLQHGITAMKINGISNYSYGGSIRRFIVSSKFEKELLIQNRQFWEDELVITGFSRYDKLKLPVSSPGSYVWIMPTWRDWLVKSERDFINSDFYNYYSKILSNKSLINCLKNANQKLIFTLHVEFEKYKAFFDNFENDVVHIADMHEEYISKRITECSMIVTDYSSIMFDVVYLKKPVLFFQFDQEMYNKYRGSYVNMETELPGKVLFNFEEIIMAMIYEIKNGFCFSSKYAEIAKKYFDFHDNDNSKRIYEAIIACREEVADEY